MTVFDEIAALLRTLDGRDEKANTRIRQLLQTWVAECRQTIALAEAVADFDRELEALLQDMSGGNATRRTEALAKLETVRLLCERPALPERAGNSGS